MRHWINLRAILGASLAIGLIVSLACGGSDEEVATPTATTAAPGPSATATPTSPPTSEQPTYGGTLTFGQTVRSLDIGATASHQWGDIGTITNIYRQLIRTSVEDRVTVEGDMAESWSVSGDGLTWNFNVRDGILDHDGDVYGAEEVAYQIYRYVDRPNGFPARRQTCWQTAVKETNWPPQPGDGVQFDASANTVTVQLIGPRGWFLACAAQAWSQFGPMKYYLPIDQSGEYRELNPDTIGSANNEIIGTGPFKVVEYSRDDMERVERFDQFFKEGRPYLDGYTVFAINEISSVVAAMRAGQIDGIGFFTTPQLTDAQSLKQQYGDEIIVAKTLALGWRGMVLNMARAPLGPVDDPSAQTIRTAIQLFTDREKLNQFVYQGIGWPTFYYFFNWDWIYSMEDWQQMPGFNPNTKQADVAEAKRLMESLGYGPDNMLKFDLLCSDSGPDRRECEVLAEELKQIHINVNARLQSETTEDQLEGRFDITLVARGYTYEDPQNYDSALFLPFEEYGTSNWGRYANDDYLNLYLKQLPITDQQERGAILRQMADILYEDAAFIPTNRPGTLPIIRGNWRGWTPANIHISNYSLENVWLSSDLNATPEMLKDDVFANGTYPLR